MYRKDECLSLFKDPEQLEADELQNSCDKKPALMWHKVQGFGYKYMSHLAFNEIGYFG